MSQYEVLCCPIKNCHVHSAKADPASQVARTTVHKHPHTTNTQHRKLTTHISPRPKAGLESAQGRLLRAIVSGRGHGDLAQSQRSQLRKQTGQRDFIGSVTTLIL